MQTLPSIAKGRVPHLHHQPKVDILPKNHLGHAMRKGFGDGTFALGLVIGSGVTLILFIWFGRAFSRGTLIDDNANDSAHELKESFDWDGFLGPFVSPSDTIAQWAVTLLTGFLAFLVWKTLAATQSMAADTRQMAKDTRRIGEAQSRAYVSVESCYAREIPFEDGTRLTVTFKNTGNSPAFGLRIGLRRSVMPDYSQKRVFFKAGGRQLTTDLGAGESRTVSLDCSDLEFDTIELLPATQGERLFCFAYATYYDAFDKQRVRRTIFSAQSTRRFDDQVFMSACARGNRST